jgi:hypothetical protein
MLPASTAEVVSQHEPARTQRGNKDDIWLLVYTISPFEKLGTSFDLRTVLSAIRWHLVIINRRDAAAAVSPKL